VFLKKVPCPKQKEKDLQKKNLAEVKCAEIILDCLRTGAFSLRNKILTQYLQEASIHGINHSTAEVRGPSNNLCPDCTTSSV
jgi:hypothetical protein